MSKTKVYIAGATGNVGQQIIKGIVTSVDLKLVGGCARTAGRDLGEVAGLPAIGVRTSNMIEPSLREAAPDVVVDFTSPAVVMKNLETYARLGLDAVVGTTGFDEERLAQARQWARERGLRWGLIANFCLSMNLALDFMRKVRRYYPYVTIIERHHAQKADAPSGTSLWLARALATGTGGDLASRELLPGVLGGDFGGVRILSERLPVPTVAGEHEVVLARRDEVMRIKVAEYSAAVHTDAVLLAIRAIKKLAPGSLVTSLHELPGELWDDWIQNTGRGGSEWQSGMAFLQ